MSATIEVVPVAETADTVTLRRSDYEALREALEDAADVAILRAAEAAIEHGESELLPAEMVKRLLAGHNPVRVWREHRELTARQLAAAAGLSPSYLSEIESDRKPGSFEAMARLARVLRIDMEDLARSRADDDSPHTPEYGTAP